MPENQEEETIERILTQEYKGRTIRVFVSYSKKDKKLAGEVKYYLEKYGLRVFLAHEDIKPPAEWEKEIIHNLKGCDIFLPIITNNFKQSDWTDQETGIAFALDKFTIPLQVNTTPYGFIGKYQSLKINTDDMKSSCAEIIKIIEEKDVLKEALRDCLIHVLASAPHFWVTEDVLKFLSKYTNFTQEHINQIFRAAILNNQFRCPRVGKRQLKVWLSEYEQIIHPLLRQRYEEVKDIF